MSEHHANVDVFSRCHNKKLVTFPTLQDVKAGNAWGLWFAWNVENDVPGAIGSRILWLNFRIVKIFYENNETFYLTDKMCLSSNIEEAKPTIHGFIKGDGCCQWWADCVHTDDSKDLESLSALLSKVYEHANKWLYY